MSYNRRLFGSALIALGAFFLIEHVYQWGFMFWDFIGHEWLGLFLVIVGILLNITFDKQFFSKELK